MKTMFMGIAQDESAAIRKSVVCCENARTPQMMGIATERPVEYLEAIQELLSQGQYHSHQIRQAIDHLQNLVILESRKAESK